MPARSPSRLIALEARLGYTFTDPTLLRLALTHRSYTYEAAHGPSEGIVHANDVQHRNTPGTDNEQLEFLGDAVLGLLVTEALLREFPACSEGELTRLRAALVSRARMAEFGRELTLGEHILLGKGVEQTFGRERPALLANAAEAVIAAIFLDAQRTGKEPLTILRHLLNEHLLAPDLPLLRTALAEAPERGALRDAKTLLQERVQAQSVGKLRYLDLAQSGPPHDRRFTVEVRLEPLPSDPTTPSKALAIGEGRSKKDAQQAAAALALVHWPEAAPKDSHPSPEAEDLFPALPDVPA